MKKFIVSVLLILGLVGCATPTQSLELEYGTRDAFYSALDNSSWGVVRTGSEHNLAHTICEAVESGVPVADVIDILERTYTAQDAETFAGVTFTAYCWPKS